MENKKLSLKKDNYKIDSSQWLIMEGFTKHGLKQVSQEKHFGQVSCTSEDMSPFIQYTSLSLHQTFNTKRNLVNAKNIRMPMDRTQNLLHIKKVIQPRNFMTIRNMRSPLVELQNLVYIIQCILV